MSFSIIRSVGLFLVIAGMFFSCSDSNQLETKSGLKVDLIRRGGDTVPVKNGVATLNMKFETEDGRLLFDSDKRGGAIAVRITDEDKGLLDEVVDILKVGDSVFFKIPAEDLFEKTYGLDLPDSIERGTPLLFNMGVENTYTMMIYEAMMEERNEQKMDEWRAAAEKQLEADVKAIDERLDNEGKSYIKLESGVRMIVNKEGNGQKPTVGELIRTHYVGRYFTSGDIFDQSDQSGEPYRFMLGSGVMSGWSLAFAELKEGTSATLYIPSGLGYGQTQYGTIPPNSILIFDVDFVRIEK
ncbi:MAG: FKBP-type peptidyl-prolyl cis-trans isomerase [Bacteroidota bacterium]